MTLRQELQLLPQMRVPATRMAQRRRMFAPVPPGEGRTGLMRVAIFTETFLPKIDGISHTLLHLLEHLAERGHASLLFAPSGGPKKYADTAVVGVRGGRFPLYPELKLAPPWANVGAPLKAFRPDLIHVLNPVSLGLAGLRQARELEVPCVASYHTDLPGFAARWGFPFLARPLWAYLRWIHDRADLTLCPSKSTQRQLAAEGFKRLKVWARGVDTERFSPDHRQADWRKRLSAGSPNDPVLLYVGRLSAEKRIDWLKPVIGALPSAHLAIVGDGPARTSLERLFSGTPTVFTGFLTGHDLACAYSAADLFVFPAANETFGNVVLEAMASGLPVVAARSGGVAEVVEDGTTGLLFEPEDQESLIRRTRQLLIDQGTARAMGAEGRRVALQRSWTHVLDGLLHDYMTLLGRQPSGTIPEWLDGRRSLARDAQRPGE